MDETQIAEQLKKNIPQTPPPSDGSTVDPEPPKEEEIDLYHQVASPLENMMLKQQVSDYLSLSYSARLDTDVQTKVDTLLEWAVSTSQSRELADVLEAIGRKEAEMGIRHRGDKLSRLYRDIKISKQIKGLELQRGALRGALYD